MALDMVFPNNNEEEFIDTASKLGFSQLFFIYEPATIDKLKSKIANLQRNTKIKLMVGAISDPSTIGKAKKMAEIVLVASSEKDRDVLEKSRGIILFGLEKDYGKDYIHNRSSGLNHILCGLANKNKITVGFSFSSILSSADMPKLLGRIAQNIRLCRKYKVETIFASFAKHPYGMRAERELAALFELIEKH